ncbi:MAG: class II fructose-bisphosphate aldolase [Bacteroidales bacterium]|nr:class II fructose-bisphosphate aldolase [Bacteroidales bacterium]
MKDLSELMLRAYQNKIIIPAFNIPHLPMMEPVIAALRNTKTFGLIEVARLEWEKFSSKSMKDVRDTYEKHKDERFTRLHLDHIPVIDEDHQLVDYLSIIKEAIELGYGSVMVDGSRLSLEENIAATKNVVELAHVNGIPVEAELGAVVGHEDGPMPSYDELFESGQGFTDVDQALKFIEDTQVDWLSIAFGNIHGAISKAKQAENKVAARLNIEHLRKIQNIASIPMVLHGGSGIQQQYILEAVKNGITKINIGTTIRQAYEKYMTESAGKAYQAVYDKVYGLVTDELGIAGKADILTGSNKA